MTDTPIVSRRRFLYLSGLLGSGLGLSACGGEAVPTSTVALPTAAAASQPTAEPAVANGDQALQRLMEGNQRYVANKTVDPNQNETRRVELAQGQQPFATIFSCVDSRVPPELVFDRGLGDLFVIRTAGQAVDQAVLGSIEYGVAELKIPLLLVLGHEKCGAVKATLETVEQNGQLPGALGALVEAIRPAVEQTAGQQGDHLDNAIRANVTLVVQQLQSSKIISTAIAEGQLKIAGARYDLDSGAVELI